MPPWQWPVQELWYDSLCSLCALRWNRLSGLSGTTTTANGSARERCHKAERQLTWQWFWPQTEPFKKNLTPRRSTVQVSDVPTHCLYGMCGSALYMPLQRRHRSLQTFLTFWKLLLIREIFHIYPAQGMLKPCFAEASAVTNRTAASTAGLLSTMAATQLEAAC